MNAACHTSVSALIPGASSAGRESGDEVEATDHYLDLTPDLARVLGPGHSRTMTACRNLRRIMGP